MNLLLERAAAVTALADLIRAGHPLRPALCSWPDVGPGSIRSDLSRVRSRLLMTGDLETALRSAECFGEDLDGLVSICSGHERAGLDGAGVLDELARSIERRAHARGSVGAAIAGTKLQARMVAGLPLIALFLAPATHVPLFDLVGLVTIAVGGALVVGGMKWMAALIPVPPSTDDPIAAIADLMAAGCLGGLSVPEALGVAMQVVPDGLEVSARKVRSLLAIGIVPGDALRRSGDGGLETLAPTVDRAMSLGTPASFELREIAGRRRRDQRTRFESQLHKAPVRMVLPLTLCVLPAFGVLGITPFLRGLASG
ncbi:MAG: type II secretion system F family protein [Actinomycetota bacterium]